MQRVRFENNEEVGAFVCLTNTYAIVGKSKNRNFYSVLESSLSIPIVETTINTIKLCGTQVIGNKHGLLLPHTTTDSELLHIRNSLSEEIEIARVEDRFNTFGNIVLCNDFVALCNPRISQETEKCISEILKVKVYKQPIGGCLMVGTYGLMNNQGLIVHPHTSAEEIEELKSLLNLKVVAGSVNGGSGSVGGGAFVNDWIGFIGDRSTNTEITVMNSVFNLTKEDNKKLWVEKLIK